MEIGLYGIYGVYNYGCEAIVRGSVLFLNKIYPNCDIIYYSYDLENDRKILKDLNITIIPVVQRWNIYKRIINKIFSLLSIEKRILLFDYKKIISNIDIFMSIGGDIYTIPLYYRKKKKYPYLNDLIEFGNYVLKENKEVIIYGASIGPFGSYDKAIKYYQRNLSKYKMIVCREDDSVSYLKSLGMSNVMFFPDPAFSLSQDIPTNQTRDYIGINLSPLSLREIYGEISDSSIKKMAGIVKKIYMQECKDILFIPHVISKDVNDDDLRFLRNIYDNLDADIREHIKFANYESGFLGIKKDIRECKYIISARMHCAINAIHECVPTIFLSYSQKSIGMCKYVYGSEEYVVDLQHIDRDLFKLIKKVDLSIDDISNKLENRNKDIENYYQKNIIDLKNKLRKE